MPIVVEIEIWEIRLFDFLLRVGGGEIDTALITVH